MLALYIHEEPIFVFFRKVTKNAVETKVYL